MENRHDDISANDLLAKLKANVADTPSEDAAEATETGKKYHFRRSVKDTAVVTEEEILKEMPVGADDDFAASVPRDEIEELDVDALMRKYLSEEDYQKMTARENGDYVEEEDELVRTLTSIDLTQAEEGEEESFAAPDSELFAHLSRDGKVCDVPGEVEDEDEMSDFLGRNTSECHYYRFYDEYKSVHKQI